ncbi:MAG: phenylalanine--tRNA ligase subunit beta, partial [Lactobacillus sp.]|nr:phenylalanine--tRNA ligase subunit beta [Lactobacillus sp.]
VKVEDSKACPVYTARYIRGINNKAETPKWMKDRLTAIGLRSISAIVDITNYVNYDLARPSHVFDADKLKGDVVVRMAKDGEKFVSLEEKEYAMDNQSLGICDDEGIQCLGGIMGGIGKGATLETKDVLLECAMFDATVIARTGRKFQIDSDSRYRYERWVDPRSNVLGSNYITSLIIEICGGEASEVIVRGNEDDFKQAVAYIKPSNFEKLIGMPVSKEKIVEILDKLGFETSEEGDKVKAVSPTWRGDIEGEHDLIEEVVRMIGLDNVPYVSMIEGGEFPREVLTPVQKRVVDVKHALAVAGMYETVTWSFTDSNAADLFRAKGTEPILLLNPIASDLNEMRPSILPNLLIGLKNNVARGYGNVSLFEAAPEFYGRNPEEQRTVATGVRSGLKAKKAWNQPARAFDVYDVKEDAITAIRAANGPADNLQVTADAPAYYHPGRSGAMRLGKNVLAYFGEIHPNILKKMGIKQTVCAFEVYLENIPEPRGGRGPSGGKATAKKRLELSPFQPVDKDLAFIVDKEVLAANIMAAAKSADKDNIADVRVFDIYEGTGVPGGKKSIALGLTFQPQEKTYTDVELETLMNKVIQAVKAKTGGELRS